MAPAMALGFRMVSNCFQPELVAGTTKFQASCQKRGDAWVRSEIDLNHCLINANGKLHGQAEGGYGGSCKSCSYTKPALTCSCALGGFYTPTNIDLDEVLSINGGFLACFGIIGKEI